jgi:hypothetical protein
MICPDAICLSGTWQEQFDDTLRMMTRKMIWCFLGLLIKIRDGPVNLRPEVLRRTCLEKSQTEKIDALYRTTKVN